jgi:flavin-dependent dehydrogenase
MSNGHAAELPCAGVDRNADETDAVPDHREVDVLVAGLGPGGCAAALAARSQGLSTLAVEARGPEATRAQLVLVRPGAQAALRQLGLPDITEGRRTTTIRHVENRLRAALSAPSPGNAAFSLCWHTSVTALQVGEHRVAVSLLNEATGRSRTVSARHLIDATGGRLEPLGRPARLRTGPSHLVMTAEYTEPPWFEGIVGARDPGTRELYLLFPTWGRRGVIAYLDAPPGRPIDHSAFVQRFQDLAERLGMGQPSYEPWAVDVFQRALKRPGDDRVVAVGDAVGTVDVLLGAGMSTAIEDGAQAGYSVATAQRQAAAAQELALTRQVSAHIHARHRSGALRGRLMLGLRPLWARAWPSAALAGLTRDAVGPPPLLWPAVRFVFGRRPHAS